MTANTRTPVFHNTDNGHGGAIEGVSSRATLAYMCMSLWLRLNMHIIVYCYLVALNFPNLRGKHMCCHRFLP